jgi:hypothetical protein
VEHFQRLCRELGTLANVGRYYWSKLGLSNLPQYKRTILFSGPEILSIRNPLKNPERRYIAGQDALEAWDVEQMERLGLTPQYITPPAASPELPRAA